MTQPAVLREHAEGLAAGLPALMADARHLASTVVLGEHGRRRSGQGDEFWQFRPAVAGDPARSIDWRRSARSDSQFVQEKEWQAAQSVTLWVDQAQSMEFASDKNLPKKSERANLLALAVAVLLIKGGERVALATVDMHPQQGELQLARIAAGLCNGPIGADYGVLKISGMPANSQALFISDFLGDFDAITLQLTQAADQGIGGALVQVLDPQEEEFPFSGRTIFDSIGRSVSHETLKASDLRQRYFDRLAERKHALSSLAQRTGWQYYCHHTDAVAQSALLWIYGALEHGR